jgi:hypothetical protein
MTKRRRIALIAFSLVFLPAAAASARGSDVQDLPKQDEAQPVPKIGFGRKADQTVLDGPGVQPPDKGPAVMKMSKPLGFYIGAEYARNDSTLRTTKTVAGTGQIVSDADYAQDSNAFGGRAGMDAVFGIFSAGGFGSFTWSAPPTIVPTTPTFMRASERWDAEVGGRGGVATHGIFAYGLAGVGWVHREVQVGTPGVVTTASGTATGVLAGGGVELRLRAALHLFVQYEVASWDDVTLKMPAAAPQFDYAFGRHDHTLRIGVIVLLKR